MAAINRELGFGFVNRNMFHFIINPRRPDSCDAALRPLPQTPEFLTALRATGLTPMVLNQMADTVVLRRKLWNRLDVAMINRAEIYAPQRLLQVLQEQGLRRTPVVISPERPVPDLAHFGALPLMGPAYRATLPLPESARERRAALHQKWRNRLHHAEHQTLRITRQSMPRKGDHWLLQADARQQRSRGYQGWPADLTLAYVRENPGKAKLFQAFDGNEAVAGMLILRHGDRATYHISHTTERGKRLSAHNLLMWEVMGYLAARGCQDLDLGIINTEDAAGLARFKLGTGARLAPLGGTWLFWPPMGRLLAPLARLDRALMDPK